MLRSTARVRGAQSLALVAIACADSRGSVDHAPALGNAAALQGATASSLAAAGFVTSSPRLGTAPRAALSGGQAAPELPRVYLDTKDVPPSGRTIRLGAGGNLQAALRTAQPGDEILLASGAVYTGPFILPRKRGPGWITVRTDAAGQLPLEGVRITPRFAPVLAKLVTSTAEPALRTEAGATGYRITAVEITVAVPAPRINFGLVMLGGGREQTALAQLPANLVLDRVYVHGTPAADVKTGVTLNSAASAVIDSYVTDIHVRGQETQAILMWNGPGPYKITNNYLASAGENMMVGGADPAIPNLIPSDIEVRRNHFFKPMGWRGVYAGVKNSFELKNSRRVLIEGNVFENNWVEGQDGFAIVLKSMNQDSGCPWCESSQVTFRLNRIINSPGGVNLVEQRTSSNGIPVPLNNVLLQNNAFYRIGADGTNGRLFQVAQLVRNITIDHNTGFAPNQLLVFDGGQKPGFAMTNNLFGRGQYGLFGTGGAEGKAALDAFCPGWVFQRNAILGAPARLYPAGNFYPGDPAAVGFANFAGGDYRLIPGSPYRKAGTDGKDIGADIAALDSATAGVVVP
ncbi:MAG: hypothetical protein M3068_07195 [Gemmatimonadota bacterium]|nr:hypothetical protein [Gemmatimonadota bacterium]